MLLLLLYSLRLTHQVLVVIVVRVVYHAVAVPLVEPAEPADAEPLAVHRGPALEADLPQALVQTLAQRPAGDLRVELAAQPAVAVPLERGVRPTPVREQVRRQRVVRELVALGCKQIATCGFR